MHRLRALELHLRLHPAAVEAEAGDEANIPRSAPADPLFRTARPLVRVARSGLDAVTVANALETEGCILLPQVINEEIALSLAGELASYTNGTAHTSLISTHRDRSPRVALGQHGGDMKGAGRTGQGEILVALFNRSPRWLQLLDPDSVIGAVDLLLSESEARRPHLINQSGWRHHPGHDAEGSLHVDETVVELPEELLADKPGFALPIYYITALTYLVPTDVDLCPTFVVCGSHRSCRAPRDGEVRWQGREPQVVLAQAGDVLLMRSDLWHGGGTNRSRRSRFVVETVYGRRKLSQKFFPYLDFELSPTIRAAATPRQRRLLGAHPVGNYG